MRERNSSLDGLRGIAAIAVLARHTITAFGHPLGILENTYLAVDLFFLMSGYVIAQAYEAKIPERGFWWFAKVRLIRLQPMVILALLISLAPDFWFVLHTGAWPAGTARQLVGTAMAAVYLPSHLNPNDARLFPPDMALWSLSVEVAVNALFAVALPILSRRVLLIVVAVLGVFLGLDGLSHSTLDLGPVWEHIEGGYLRGLFSFGLGILLYRLPLPPLRVSQWVIFPAAITLLVGLDWLSVYIGFPLIMVASVATPQAPSTLADWLGRLSYPLYAIHQPLLALIVYALKDRQEPWWLQGTSFCIVLAVAFAVTWLVDEPLRAWLSGQNRRQKLNALSDAEPTKGYGAPLGATKAVHDDDVLRR